MRWSSLTLCECLHGLGALRCDCGYLDPIGESHVCPHGGHPSRDDAQAAALAVPVGRVAAQDQGAQEAQAAWEEHGHLLHGSYSSHVSYRGVCVCVCVCVRACVRA